MNDDFISQTINHDDIIILLNQGAATSGPRTKSGPLITFPVTRKNIKCHRTDNQYNKIIKCKESKHFCVFKNIYQLLQHLYKFIQENQFELKHFYNRIYL